MKYYIELILTTCGIFFWLMSWFFLIIDPYPKFDGSGFTKIYSYFLLFSVLCTYTELTIIFIDKLKERKMEKRAMGIKHKMYRAYIDKYLQN